MCDVKYRSKLEKNLKNLAGKVDIIFLNPRIFWEFFLFVVVDVTSVEKGFLSFSKKRCIATTFNVKCRSQLKILKKIAIFFVFFKNRGFFRNTCLCYNVPGECPSQLKIKKIALGVLRQNHKIAPKNFVFPHLLKPKFDFQELRFSCCVM